MKKLLGIILGTLLFFPVFTKAEARFSDRYAQNATVCASAEQAEAKSVSPDLGVRAKSAYLMDAASGTPVFAHCETERLPIASMCKIMTLVLCFDAIEDGTLTMEETVKVSKNASSMGGSQVFLEENGEYSVAELIKSIAVCSANDSCVALAERLAGSEALFTEKMNERAKELGAENTLFANCTGLPKEPQYSCAKDVAAFLRELLSHEEYFSVSKIWTDRFYHPKGRYTDISNTNRLVRFYDGCDGGKTGFTSQAGFCLAATAKRGGMRVISVVIGEKSSDERFEDVRTMFDYAFANYTLKAVVDHNNPLNEKVCVSGGKEKYLTVRPERSSFVFAKKGDKEEISTEIRMHASVKAPVKAGDKVGEIVVYKNRVAIDRVNVVAGQSTARAGFMDRLREVASKWGY